MQKKCNTLEMFRSCKDGYGSPIDSPITFIRLACNFVRIIFPRIFIILGLDPPFRETSPTMKQPIIICQTIHSRHDIRSSLNSFVPNVSAQFSAQFLCRASLVDQNCAHKFASAVNMSVAMALQE